MELVWALLKTIEAIIGLICLIIHIVAINDAEPMHHVVFYCGTFVGFTLTAIYGAICIVIHRGAGVTNEVIINFLGAIMYIMASMWSMYHAEMDVHLQFLTDYEEALHPFFIHCRRQSIASLVCGCVYIMHCAFAFDLLITKAPKDLTDNTTETVPKFLHLYFICPTVHEKLCEYQWFRKYVNVLDSGAMHYDNLSFLTLSIVPSDINIQRAGSEKDLRTLRSQDSNIWASTNKMETPITDTPKTNTQ